MEKKVSRNKTCINWIFGFLFAIAMSFGYQLQNREYVDFKSVWTYVSILAIGAVTGILLKLLWNLMLKRNFGAEKTMKPETEKGLRNRTWLSSSVLIWICHFIVFLGVYPGFFVYDANEELMETVNRTFSSHHPLIHVLSMGKVITGVSNIFGDVNIGIACFILIGMTIAAITYGYLVSYLRKMGMKSFWAVILTIYFGIFPVFVMYSLCSSKDGVFGCFLILSFIFLKDLVDNPEKFFESWKKPLLLTVFLMFMMLFRNNGVYALAVFGFIWALWWLFGARRHSVGLIKGLAIIVASVVLYIMVNGALIGATNAETGEKKEMLSVPIMQLTRLYVYEQGDIGDLSTEIERYIGVNGLNHYSYKISDMVKCDFNEEEFAKDSAGFFRIWWKGAKESPFTYINSALGTSFGLWYPGAVIDAYKGNTMYTFTYGDSSYFGYEVEEPGIRDSKIPAIDDFYRWLSLNPAIQKTPFIHLLFSPGFVLWVYLFFIGYFIFANRPVKNESEYSNRGRNCVCMLPYLLPLLVILTCFLGPVSLVRYSFFLWALVPVQVAEYRNQ